jgi:hypothetical protein
MTRAHRSVGDDTGDHSAAWSTLTPPVRRAPSPVSEHGAPTDDPPGADRVAASSGICDVGGLTVSEVAAAAEARGVDPSSLLGGPGQANVRADLDLAARLADPVAALVIGLARLDSAAAAVVAGMIERYAAADRRRPPTP